MKKILSMSANYSLAGLIIFLASSCMYRFALHKKIITKALIEQENTINNLTQLRSALQQQMHIKNDEILSNYQLEKIARQELSMARPNEIIYIVKRP